MGRAKVCVEYMVAAC